jgi:hypothetical protein
MSVLELVLLLFVGLPILGSVVVFVLGAILTVLQGIFGGRS